MPTLFITESLKKYWTKYKLYPKVSRSVLTTCYNNWCADGRPRGCFKKFVDYALVNYVVEDASYASVTTELDCILMVGFNIEVGPALRADRLSQCSFDGNFTPSGEYTPRSKVLYYPYNDILKECNYELIGEKLLMAMDIHEQQYPHRPISARSVATDQ